MGRRAFGLIFAILISLIWLHLLLRGVRPAGLYDPVQEIVPGAAVLMYAYQLLCMLPIVNIRQRPRALVALYLITGYMFYLWMSLLVREGFLLIAWALSLELDPKFLLFSCDYVFLAGTLMTLVAAATALLGPKVKVVTIDLPHWPKALDGFRIVQISDLHVGTLIGRRYVEQVVRKVMRQKPDLIAVTGDLGDGNPSELRKDLDPLAQLQARYGSYYVTGNHEYYWGAEAWLKAVTERGFETLVNKSKVIKLVDGSELWLAGLPDFTAAHFIPEHRSDLAAVTPPPSTSFAAKVLLAHQPKSYVGVAEAGFDLMLCGHTHNGQSFPFNFLVGRFNPFSRGLNRVKDLFVYVNSGSGYWGPPLRLAVRSEISCLVFKAMPR